MNTTRSPQPDLRDLAFIAAQWHARQAQQRADAGDEASRSALAVLIAWQLARLGVSR